jgi:hypothetical protein
MLPGIPGTEGADRMTLEEVREELESRRIFRQVFDSPEGSQVLTWLLNEANYFSMDPQLADPLLAAFANKLLNKLGINHPENLFTDTRERLQAANDRDLRFLEKKLSNDGG